MCLFTKSTRHNAIIDSRKKYQVQEEEEKSDRLHKEEEKDRLQKTIDHRKLRKTIVYRRRRKQEGNEYQNCDDPSGYERKGGNTGRKYIVARRT